MAVDGDGVVSVAVDEDGVVFDGSGDGNVLVCGGGGVVSDGAVVGDEV